MEPKVTSVSANGCVSIAVTNEDENNVFLWGNGDNYQLCNAREGGNLEDDSVDELYPYRPTLKGRKVYQACLGSQHTLFLLAPRNQPL